MSIRCHDAALLRCLLPGRRSRVPQRGIRFSVGYLSARISAGSRLAPGPCRAERNIRGKLPSAALGTFHSYLVAPPLQIVDLLPASARTFFARTVGEKDEHVRFRSVRILRLHCLGLRRHGFYSVEGSPGCHRPVLVDRAPRALPDPVGGGSRGRLHPIQKPACRDFRYSTGSAHAHTRNAFAHHGTCLKNQARPILR